MLNCGINCVCDFCGHTEFFNEDDGPNRIKPQSEIKCDIMQKGWLLINKSLPNETGGFDYITVCCCPCCKNIHDIC